MKQSNRPDGRPSFRWYRFVLGKGLDDGFPTNLDFPGIYAIFAGRPQELLYIGESRNLDKRLRNHIRLTRYSHEWMTVWGTWAKITVAVRHEKGAFEARMAEGRLIVRLRPICNKQWG